MKPLITSATAVAIVVTLLPVTASANVYPIAPPGTTVTLSLNDFIQSVPDGTPGLTGANPVIGDIIGQHPGAFITGAPLSGEFFIGVFGGRIGTGNPDAAVYLWETSGGNEPHNMPETGPLIQLGFWDGTAFTPEGLPQLASYLGTGDSASDKEILSSVTPLSDFGVTPGFPFTLNAVKIEIVDASVERQVTAVATNVIPEPGMGFLLSVFSLGILGCSRWRRIKAR